MSWVESISKILIILMHIKNFYEYIDPLFSVNLKHRRFHLIFCSSAVTESAVFRGKIMKPSWIGSTHFKKIKKIIIFMHMWLFYEYISTGYNWKERQFYLVCVLFAYSQLFSCQKNYTREKYWHILYLRVVK